MLSSWVVKCFMEVSTRFYQDVVQLIKYLTGFSVVSGMLDMTPTLQGDHQRTRGWLWACRSRKLTGDQLKRETHFLMGVYNNLARKPGPARFSFQESVHSQWQDRLMEGVTWFSQVTKLVDDSPISQNLMVNQQSFFLKLMVKLRQLVPVLSYFQLPKELLHLMPSIR